MSKMSAKNTLFALVAGAATGAVVALLLAPDTGNKTRKKLLKEAISAKDTLAYRLMQAEEQLEHLRDKLGKKTPAGPTA